MMRGEQLEIPPPCRQGPLETLFGAPSTFARAKLVAEVVCHRAHDETSVAARAIQSERIVRYSRTTGCAGPCTAPYCFVVRGIGRELSENMGVSRFRREY